jgi:hypothetical protein
MPWLRWQLVCTAKSTTALYTCTEQAHSGRETVGGKRSACVAVRMRRQCAYTTRPAHGEDNAWCKKKGGFKNTKSTAKRWSKRWWRVRKRWRTCKRLLPAEHDQDPVRRKVSGLTRRVNAAGVKARIALLEVPSRCCRSSSSSSRDRLGKRPCCRAE